MLEKSLKIDPASIAIATTTYYPKWYRGKLRSVKHTDKVRGDLALEFMQKAQSIGCQLVVVDGKSSRSFRLELFKRKGINKICLSLSIKPIVDNKADIVVPKRDDALFGKTYPLYMYELEVQANKFFNEILHFHRLFKSNTEDFDIFFGPRVIKNEAKIVRLFMKKYHGVVASPSFNNIYFGPEKGVRKVFLAKRKTQQLSILLDLAHLIGFLEKNKKR